MGYKTIKELIGRKGVNEIYRIMIVDDESLHRKGLMALLHKINSEYFLIEAYNEVQALEQLQSIAVDIIITDIRMPDKDEGLQLLKNVKKLYPSIEVIILTAYGEFEYAKTAVKCGAFDYILKPVDASEVEDVMVRVDKKIRLIKEENVKKQTIEKKLTETKDIYVNHLLNRLLFCKSPDEELLELKKIYPLQQSGYILLFQLEEKSGNPIVVAPQLNKLKYELKKEMDSYITIPFLLENHEYLFAIILLGDKFLDKNRLKQYQDKIENIINIRCLISISNRAENLFINAEKLYKNASIALQFHFYCNGEPIYFDDLKYKSYNNVIDHLKEEKLTEVLIKGDVIKSKELFETLLTCVIKDGLPLPSILRQKIVYWLFNLMRQIDSVIETEEIAKIMSTINSILINTPNIHELRKQVFRIFDMIVLQLRKQKESANNDIVEYSKKFIQEHYMEDIGLDTVAEKFYFNPSYFSTLFKNSAGKSFSEFLMEIRMKKAQELLLLPNSKIRNIAEKIGYKDSSYFARVYKRYFGVSPEVYRKINSKMNLD